MDTIPSSDSFYPSPNEALAEKLTPPLTSIIRSTATGTRTIVNFNDLPEMTTAEFTTLADDLITHEDLTGQDTESWWHFEVRSSRTQHPHRIMTIPVRWADFDPRHAAVGTEPRGMQK